MRSLQQVSRYYVTPLKQGRMTDGFCEPLAALQCIQTSLSQIKTDNYPQLLLEPFCQTVWSKDKDRWADSKIHSCNCYNALLVKAGIRFDCILSPPEMIAFFLIALYGRKVV